MKINLLRNSFLNFCEKNGLEKNKNQIDIINLLTKFFESKKKIINFFAKPNSKLCFYLFGGVGVGKTMILNFFYNFVDLPKKRAHFNEFMIEFHENRFKNNKDPILSFVKKIKKYDLLYLDEFQVTNIVDAMILGKLFETIFKENIKVIITSNIKLENLYKDGLQREQFLPFISIIKKNSIQKELIIDEDYRMQKISSARRAFSPINEKTKFKINQIFREYTKGKKLRKISIKVKGREFLISNYYEGVAKFNFKDLCDNFLGAEDYVKISEVCNFIFIENIPVFNDENADQQNRFITLIDILYEKNIPLVISMENTLDKIGSSKKLKDPFKRTVSRLFELSSMIT